MEVNLPSPLIATNWTFVGHPARYQCPVLWQARWNRLGPFAITEDRFRTGGEDLPSAYRLVPVKPDECWGAIVAYYDPHAQAPRFRLLWFALQVAQRCDIV